LKELVSDLKIAVLTDKRPIVAVLFAVLPDESISAYLLFLKPILSEAETV
jgi:hypothetical protein